jgi:uncharacterized protein (TIGR00288 family)
VPTPAPVAPTAVEAQAPAPPPPPEARPERPESSATSEPGPSESGRQAALYEPPASSPLTFDRAEAYPAASPYDSPYGAPSYGAPDDESEQDELFPDDEEDDEDEGSEISGGLEAGSAQVGDAAEEAHPDDDAEGTETAEGAEKDEAGEKRGRRSRRSRGGRRRSGRSAAPTNGGAAEEDDEPHEDADDEPSPISPPSPAPVQAAPPVAAIAPRRRERERERERERPDERERERERDRDSFFVSPSELLPREIYVPVAERPRSHSEEKKIALFCDLENIALGVRDSDVAKFDINLVLVRLLEKGKIIVKKAYADWERYSDYKRPFHEAAIELIDIPQKYYSGKNSADIKMVVDAMDLSYSKEHLDTFVLLSGDSDFSPLVSKLKENNKYVIGIGVKNSSSNLLVDNCDEFIYYEDVWRDSSKAPQIAGLNKKAAEAFMLMVESIQALTRENKDVLWGSMIKQTMQRKKPSFNEGYYGYSTFSELLEDAERKNIIKLKKDQRSGTYIVTGFAKR